MSFKVQSSEMNTFQNGLGRNQLWPEKSFITREKKGKIKISGWVCSSSDQKEHLLICKQDKNSLEII